MAIFDYRWSASNQERECRSFASRSIVWCCESFGNLKKIFFRLTKIILKKVINWHTIASKKKKKCRNMFTLLFVQIFEIRTICTSCGRCWTSCCQTCLHRRMTLTSGSISTTKRNRNKWSISCTKYFVRSCFVGNKAFSFFHYFLFIFFLAVWNLKSQKICNQNLFFLNGFFKENNVLLLYKDLRNVKSNFTSDSVICK